MIEMKLFGWILFFTMVFGVFLVYADISTLGAEISKLDHTLKEQLSKKNKLLKESDRLAEKITKEKRKSQGRSSRRLDSMFRESQRLVSELESISRQIVEIESQLKRKYSMAITTLVRKIEKAPDEKRKTSTLKQLLKYMESSERLKQPIKFEMSEVNLEVQEDDTALDIRQKADFLSDQTALLKAKVFQVDAHIAELDREKSLRDKVKGFADEISFFDDILFADEEKVEQALETRERNTTKEPKTYGAETNMRTDEIEPEVTQPPEGIQTPTIVRRNTSDSPFSDLVLSSGNIGKQIELLKQKRLQLEKQIQQLSQKTQNFYKRAEELSSPKQQ